MRERVIGPQRAIDGWSATVDPPRRSRRGLTGGSAAASTSFLYSPHRAAPVRPLDIRRHAMSTDEKFENTKDKLSG